MYSAARGYEISSGGGWLTAVEGRSVAPPTFAESQTPIKAEAGTDTDTRNVLIGYALLFNQVIQHDDCYMLVRPTAFKDLMQGKPRYFQHGHDNGIRVASTNDKLTLYADEYGLAFKLYIPPTALGRHTRDLVRSNVNQAMSAGFKATSIETTVVDGVEVLVVNDADLHEISLVEHGANSDAFAVLVEDSAEWVTDMCKSMRMTDEMHHSHLNRIRRRLDEISEDLAAVE
jgi:HK97 family phage prohead protease